MITFNLSSESYIAALNIVWWHWTHCDHHRSPSEKIQRDVSNMIKLRRVMNPHLSLEV